jgi:hypothetical protein
LNQNPVVANSA